MTRSSKDKADMMVELELDTGGVVKKQETVRQSRQVEGKSVGGRGVTENVAI